MHVEVAKQYVTGAPVPYTGYIPVNDYVNDFQVPQMLELVKDPLTHLVRNCADHGIESAAQRRAAGKAAKGGAKPAEAK